ncbi:hypothetical protein [Sphingobacterium siyangense]|uniref:hypothetical protein n=1 Tax=Sphingobacterium siyangense TaxID=459529 RepID=UPI003C7275A6
MNFHFNFRPVGQGGFTSITIKDNDSIFNIIYDCGSVTSGSYLYNEITKAKTDLIQVEEKKVIDLLIISHFDEDHVNGIQELLQNVHCKILVIPFMTIVERLVLFTKGSKKSDWHIRLLQNPKSFFEQEGFQIDKILMIDCDNPEQEKTTTEFSLSNNVQSNDNIQSNVSGQINRIINSGLTFDNKVLYMQIPFSLKIESIGLKLKFYIQPLPKASIATFENFVKYQFHKIELIKLFNNKYRSNLRSLYKIAFKKINKTSLCVSIFKEKYSWIHYSGDPNPHFNYDTRLSGVMMTGDAYLKSRKNREAFINYYEKEIDKTLVYQIPHHGSKANSKLDNSNKLWNFELSIMQYGIGRKKHPSKEVINYISNHNINFKSITENEGFEFEYTIC